jgi:hypothetical protein
MTAVDAVHASGQPVGFRGGIAPPITAAGTGEMPDNLGGSSVCIALFHYLI